jgi:S1-C subfamily serine protease
VHGSLLDLLLLVLMVIFAINGYRQGFVVGLLSFLGFFAGAALGLQIGPAIATHFSQEAARVAISLGCVFGIALLGQALTNWVGEKIRGNIRNRTGQSVDDVGGAVISVLALLVVVWLVAAPLGSSSLPGLARSVRQSAILHGVNTVMPQAAQSLSDELRSTVNTSGFPDVFGELIPTNVRQVPAPNAALAKLPVVRNSERSVVKVEGSAPSCNRRIEGSGFVFAPGRVLTNAHVVAGTRQVSVAAPGQRYVLSGVVVVYDPHRDLAVIDVPGLDAPVMQFAGGRAQADDDAIVLGYPLDGPYDAEAARIRDARPIKGPDIYNDRTVTRDIYTIRGLVRSGNSGGPLIDSDGDVLGVIFAAAADDPQTGFALTNAEASSVIKTGRTATQHVSTGSCTE